MRSGKSKLEVCTPCVKVIHGKSLGRPHHYWLYTTHGATENWPEIKANEAAMETSNGPTPSATLPMHLLGPTPIMLSSTFGVGPGASVSATNPGSVAQTMHGRKDEIEAPP